MTSAPSKRRAAGDRAETLAEHFLVQAGHLVVARNFCVRGGEVDLIVTRGQTLVFVEVRQRRKGALVGAIESVTATKRARILRAADAFLERTQAAGREIRFDIVGVTPGRPPHIEHVEAAFDAGGAGEG